MNRVGVFGSTGSVGRQALDVIAAHPEHLQATVIAAGSSVAALAEQARSFRPAAVVIGDASLAGDLRSALGPTFHGEVLAGPEALAAAATREDVDTVLAAVTGIKGLALTLAGVRAGKRLALANKESLVAAGPLVMETARSSGAKIIPVDSEHNALFQALASGREEEVASLILTASGGPFRRRPRETWEAITVEEALAHPTWDMGRKISIDSATMMNKALEIVEAHYLFDAPADRIQVVIHPQSVVHSMVLFRDGSVIAQMSPPDMRGPIQHALTWPERLPSGPQAFDPSLFTGLTFEEPDLERFPSLRLGFEAARRGGLHGTVLNAANEEAVALFLGGRIPFVAIFSLVETVFERCSGTELTSLDSVMDADRWAREEIRRCS